jgi:NADPH-dependent 2,4-dienoyl-CoA reductase/sulfur reductase-like enzyme
MAAAVCAAEGGQQVTLIDDNPAPGGQIWRGGDESEWFARLASVRAARMQGARVVAAEERALVVELADRVARVTWDKLILATGARERFLPFPGWTVPGVFGAGGIQALVKSGLDVRGKRVVVGGTGPLLLAVADLLRSRGASVVRVAEQAPASRVRRFALGLPWNKLWQGITLRIGAPYRTDCWVEEALPGRVRLNRGGWVECDYAAIGYGLVPNTELAQLAGPEAVLAGECAGIGGVEKSLVEGQIAGHRAAGNIDAAERLRPAHQAALDFARRLEETFALRDELRHLAAADTTVCRCESVPRARLDGLTSWREAKLHTRCGMGPCQGRLCGPATEFLYNWRPDSVRPPILPARVATLMGGN